jgi:enoyl-CoA hydratase/carnithine racemase
MHGLIMAAELDHALPLLDSDDSVRAIVLTGAGKAFCAGSDLNAGTTSFSDAKDENLDASKAACFYP